MAASVVLSKDEVHEHIVSSLKQDKKQDKKQHIATTSQNDSNKVTNKQSDSNIDKSRRKKKVELENTTMKTKNTKILQSIPQDIEVILQSIKHLRVFWGKLDSNGNGKVAYREVEECFVEYLPLIEKTILHKAFQETIKNTNDSFVGKKKFRKLLKNIIKYNQDSTEFSNVKQQLKPKYIHGKPSFDSSDSKRTVKEIKISHKKKDENFDEIPKTWESQRKLQQKKRIKEQTELKMKQNKRAYAKPWKLQIVNSHENNVRKLLGIPKKSNTHNLSYYQGKTKKTSSIQPFIDVRDTLHSYKAFPGSSLYKKRQSMNQKIKQNQSQLSPLSNAVSKSPTHRTQREIRIERANEKIKKAKDKSQLQKILKVFCIEQLHSVLIPAKQYIAAAEERSIPQYGTNYARRIAHAKDALQTAGLSITNPSVAPMKNAFTIQKERIERLCKYAFDAAQDVGKVEELMRNSKDSTVENMNIIGDNDIGDDENTMLGKTLLTASQRGDIDTIKAVVRLHGAPGLVHAINTKTPDGFYTPLTEAVLGGFSNIAEELVAANASVDIDVCGIDLVETAKTLGHYSIVHLIETVHTSNRLKPLQNTYVSRLSAGKSSHVIQRRGCLAPKWQPKPLAELTAKRHRELRKRRSHKKYEDKKQIVTRSKQSKDKRSKLDVTQRKKYADALRARHKKAYEMNQKRHVNKGDDSEMRRLAEEYNINVTGYFESSKKIRSKNTAKALHRHKIHNTNTMNMDQTNAYYKRKENDETELMHELAALREQSEIDSLEVNKLSARFATINHSNSRINLNRGINWNDGYRIDGSISAKSSKEMLQKTRNEIAIDEKVRQKMKSMKVAENIMEKKSRVQMASLEAKLHEKQDEIRLLKANVDIATRNKRLAEGQARAIQLRHNVHDDAIRAQVWQDARIGLERARVAEDSAFDILLKNDNQHSLHT